MNTIETNQPSKFATSGFGKSLEGEQVIKLHKLSVGWTVDSIVIPITEVGAPRLDNQTVGLIQVT